MEYSELLRVALNFATAILLGALIGIEREKRKTEEGETGGVAGLRTFTLLALFGAAAAWLAHSAGSPWILAAAVLRGDGRRGVVDGALGVAQHRGFWSRVHDAAQRGTIRQPQLSSGVDVVHHLLPSSLSR